MDKHDKERLRRSLEQIGAMTPMYRDQAKHVRESNKFLAEYSGCYGHRASIEAEKKFMSEAIRGVKK